MTPEERSDLLRRWGLEAGFDRAGVAKLGPSEHDGALQRWLERGFQAGMSYMEREPERRADPRRSLEGARSALCVALDYAPEPSGQAEGDLWRGVARYARGRDYHDVMGERLRLLCARIEQFFPGTTTRPYVDTGPVLERELAARAGLGAIGKNTNLLHPEAGSYFLLGEILLTLDLEPDTPIADLCGSCRACLDACPTDAFAQPWVLDSRRCISYWTIEHRGDLPEAVRPELGEWVFGCDICQEACPVNIDGATATDPALALPADRSGLGLDDVTVMSREEYVERFRASPMKRAKLDGLGRNAAVALANRGRQEDVGHLREALHHGEAMVKRHAAWGLGAVGGKDAEAALLEGLERDPDAGHRDEMASALSQLKPA
ncbi:MAG: tRNA epoxyqueuosine(34) reductase QueG [Acidobacteriota bacterium]|nr:tRNA epoxyqueuosine(34) reductase QueG [Acidobacteriota bacterium]